MAKETQKNFCVPLASPERAEVNRDIALSLVALNKFKSAYTILEEIKDDIEGEFELWDNLFAASLERGIILKEIGQDEKATSIFAATVSKFESQFGNNHYNTAEARMMLALSETKMPIDTEGQTSVLLTLSLQT